MLRGGELRVLLQWSIILAHNRVSSLSKMDLYRRETSRTKRGVLGATKSVNRESLNVSWPKNENRLMIHTYLNSVKAEDSRYTQFQMKF